MNAQETHDRRLDEMEREHAEMKASNKKRIRRQSAARKRKL